MKYPLVSSYGTISILPHTDPKYQVLDISKIYGITKALLKLQLNPEQCNDRTINTRDVFGHDTELDLLLYEYDPLPKTRWMRLLTFVIDKTAGIRTMTCQLTHHSFEEAETLEYEALSYAWGDPYRTHHLVCDGGKIPITSNLADFFRCQHPGDYHFWIDAVCINQRDRTERGHQVNQMRDVYRNANKVRAFVGSIQAADDQSLHPQGKRTNMTERSLDIQALRVLNGISLDVLQTDVFWLALQTDCPWDLRTGLLRRYFRIQAETVRGLLLKMYHLLRSCFNSSSGPNHNWFHYKWHYTIRRWQLQINMNPLDVMLKRPYFTRRWVCTSLLHKTQSVRQMGEKLLE